MKTSKLINNKLLQKRLRDLIEPELSAALATAIGYRKNPSIEVDDLQRLLLLITTAGEYLSDIISDAGGTI